MYFAALWAKFLKPKEKKSYPFPCISILEKFLAISNYKKRTTGINTYTLTLNKNSIFKQFLTLSYHKKAP